MRNSIVLVIAASALAGCQYQETAEPAPTDNAAATNAVPPATSAAPPAAAPTPGDTPLVKVATDPALQWGPCPAPLPAGCELSVLHGDPARPNADVLLRIPGGAIIPPHRHSSAERMILVSGQLEVKYQGAKAATLTAGNYAFGPANLPHRATCVGAAPCTLFIAFEGPVDVTAVEGEIN